MKDWRKEWLTFDRKDRLAIPFLLVIICALSIAFFYWDQWYYTNLNTEHIELAVRDSSQNLGNRSFNKDSSYKRSNNNQSSYSGKAYKKSNQEAELFQFDPNTISKDSLMMLGFSEKEAQAFINFRSSGYTFHEAEDIKKSFVVTEKDFQRLVKYISLQDKNDKEYDGQKKYHKNITVEVNSADSSELRKIYGVGKVYAKGILKYRDLLGGYHHKEQLKEVYGINDTVYQSIKDQIKVDSARIKKMNVNHADFGTLLRHPYIEKHVVQSLISYREQHGNYSQKQQIKNLHLIDDKLYVKLKHYITVE